MTERYDAVVVGSGPNGLAAAVELARNRRSVLVLEAAGTLGGGMRSSELTLPGYLHDECAAVVPLTIGSPFLSSLPLDRFGFELVQPAVPVAHPLDDGSAVLLERSLECTMRGLGPDAQMYARLVGPGVRAWRTLLQQFLGPLRWPRQPLTVVQFGIAALMPASTLARLVFRGPRARALFAGNAAHAVQPLERPATAAFGLVFHILGHAVGWPIVRGGTQRLADALAEYVVSLGGATRTNSRVRHVSDLPRHGAALLDLTPRQVLEVAGSELPDGYRRQLRRYRYGPGVFKIDWALDAPIPWTADGCRQAGTVHVGGTLDEVAASERAVWRGEHTTRPFVIVAQPTLFDASRAPRDKHIAWAYCHVPNGSTADMTDAIEGQVERFAPGFRNRVIARTTLNAAQMEAYNPNYVGGDINGGVQDLPQMWTRPAARLVPYTTPNPDLFVCSSSTPPGGGVHGMCGYHAARAALHHLR